MASQNPRLLSSAWINQRMLNVAEQASEILMSIVFEGILRDGLLPGEMEVDSDFVRKLTDAQFDAIMSSGSDETKEDLMVAQRDLDN